MLYQKIKQHRWIPAVNHKRSLTLTVIDSMADVTSQVNQQQGVNNLLVRPGQAMKLMNNSLLTLQISEYIYLNIYAKHFFIYTVLIILLHHNFTKLYRLVAKYTTHFSSNCSLKIIIASKIIVSTTVLILVMNYLPRMPLQTHVQRNQRRHIPASVWLLGAHWSAQYHYLANRDSTCSTCNITRHKQ